MSLTIDPTKRHAYFECPSCEPGYGNVEFDIDADELEAVLKNSREDKDHDFTCPRGHLLHGNDFRGTVKVDEGGYPIDRNHPLWGATAIPRALDTNAGRDKLSAAMLSALDAANDSRELRSFARVTRYVEVYGGAPERHKCSACAGTGVYDHDGSPPCASCNGTGYES